MASRNQNLLIFVIAFMLLDHTYARLKPDQYKAAMNLIGNACYVHYPAVTHVMIQELLAGKYQDDNEDLKCFANCVWEHLGSMHLGEFDAEHTVEQFEFIVPVDWQADYRKGVDMCKDKGVGAKDHCESGYLISKCFIENVPKYYIPY